MSNVFDQLEQGLGGGVAPTPTQTPESVFDQLEGRVPQPPASTPTPHSVFDQLEQGLAPTAAPTSQAPAPPPASVFDQLEGRAPTPQAPQAQQQPPALNPELLTHRMSVLHSVLNSPIENFGVNLHTAEGQADLANKAMARLNLARQVQQAGGLDKAAMNDGLVNNAVGLLQSKLQPEANRQQQMIQHVQDQGATGALIDNAGQMGATTLGMAAMPFMDEKAKATLAAMEQQTNLEGGAHPIAGLAGQFAGLGLDPVANAAFKAAGPLLKGLDAPLTDAAGQIVRDEAGNVVRAGARPIIQPLIQGDIAGAGKGIASAAARGAIVNGGITALTQVPNVAQGNYGDAAENVFRSMEAGLIQGPLFHAGSEGAGMLIGAGIQRGLTPSAEQAPQVPPAPQEAPAAPEPAPKASPLPADLYRPSSEALGQLADATGGTDKVRDAAQAKIESHVEASQSVDGALNPFKQAVFDAMDTTNPQDVQRASAEYAYASKLADQKFPQIDNPQTPEEMNQQHAAVDQAINQANTPPTGQPAENLSPGADTNSENAIIPGSPAPAGALAIAKPYVPEQTAASKISATVQNLAKNAKSIIPDALNRERERLSFIGDKTGYAAPAVERDLKENFTAQRYGEQAGKELYKQINKGLPDGAMNTAIDILQHNRREIMVDHAAEAAARELVGLSKNSRGPVPPQFDQIKRAFQDAVNAADSPGARIRGTATGLTPQQVEGQITQRLNAIDPQLVTRYQDMTRARPEYKAEELVKVGGQLPKLDPMLLADLRSNPGVNEAIDRIGKYLSPQLDAMRQASGLKMDPVAAKYRLPFINLPTENVGDAPVNMGANGSIVVQKRFNAAASGEGEYVKDPEEYIQRVFAGHYKTFVETKLANTLKNSKLAFMPSDSGAANSVDPALTTKSGKPDSKFVATIDGRQREMVPIDLAPDQYHQQDIRYVPKDVADQIAKMRQDNDPESKSLFNTVGKNMVGWQIMVSDFGSHARRLLDNTAGRVAAAGYDWKSIIPGIGSQLAAGQRARELGRTPFGETMQLLNERLGSDSGRGFNLGDKGRQHIGEKYLFDRDIGIDSLLRRTILDSGLRIKTSNEYVKTVEGRVNAGVITPVEGVNEILGKMKAEDHAGLGRFVNGTAGYLNTQTRSMGINKWKTVFPFLGSEAGTIPNEIRNFITAGITPESLVKAHGPGELFDRLGKQIASGPIGTYLAMNLMNYATTKMMTGQGKWLFENDDKHRTDVAIAPGWYLSNFSPALSRAARLFGVKNALNQKDIRGVKAAPLEITNEVLAMVHPVMKTMFSAATEGMKGGPRSLHVLPDGSLLKLPSKTSILAPTLPFGRNAFDSYERGNGAGTGLVKDVSGTAGIQLSHDDTGPRQQRMQQTSALAAQYTDALTSTDQGSADRQNQTSELRQQAIK